MNTRLLTGISASILLSAIGCGGTAGGGDPAANNDPNPAASASKPSVPSVTSTLLMRGMAKTADGSALAGVIVCGQASDVLLGVDDGAADSPPNCTASTQDGTWMLTGVPANTQLALTFEREGFVPTLRPVQTGMTDIVIAADETRFVPVVDAPKVMGTTLDVTKGHIEFFGPASRATVTAVSLSGRAEHATYVDSSDPSAGVFANIASGYYVLTFQSAGADCTTAGLYGYPMTTYETAGEARVVVPVLDGFVTSPIRANCSNY